MFQLFRTSQSLAAVLKEVERRRWRTKSWISSSGRKHPDRAFTKASLQHLLMNAIYAGTTARLATNRCRGKIEASSLLIQEFQFAFPKRQDPSLSHSSAPCATSHNGAFQACRCQGTFTRTMF
jgi:hypothetical protein